VSGVQERGGVAFSELTTLRVGGPARRLVVVESEADAVACVQACDAQGDPLLVLGGGSNLIVGDAGFDGTALALSLRGAAVASAADHVEVTVAAGEPWDDLVARAVAEGWSGLEALSGIPGLTGATPIQNVGAYGREVADSVVSVTLWDRGAGRRSTWAASSCRFGYRTSAFKQAPGEYVVLAVTLRLQRSTLSAPVRYAELARHLEVSEGAQIPSADVRAAVLDLRRGKGMVLDDADHDTWSVGSFFTNPLLALDEAARLPASAPRWPTPEGPVKFSAAWLIERAGFGRGFGAELTHGRATVSSKHALAVTNRGGATAADVLAVARAARDGVVQRFGVALVAEPTLVECHL
jgi:UDP-N-acetylmuramate dehydrogenase